MVTPPLMSPDNWVPRPVVVVLDRPDVAGDTVRFSWRGDHSSKWQLRRRWQVRYQGVPLERYHRAVLFEVLLTLQLPVWSQLGHRVLVRLPEPVPQVVLSWWQAYHQAWNVSFTGPVSHEPTYEPFRGPRPVPRPRAVAVSYGGGKDSTLAAHALLASRDPDDVLLLHVVQHFSERRVRKHRTAARSRRTVVSPARRHTGSPVQTVETDFLSTLTAAGKVARPHVNLYTVALLPALLHHGVGAVTVSRTAAGYTVRDDGGGTREWSNPSGRPERLLALSRYYAAVLGVDVAVESTHYAITELVSFSSLLRLHPRAHSGMVMCMRTRSRRRFCMMCSKCTEFALFGLAHGHIAPDLDLDRLLAHSTHVGALVGAARAAGDAVAWHGNSPYVPEIGTRSHFSAFAHALHTLDRGVLPRLSPRAAANLDAIVAAWGRRPFPAAVSIDQGALAACGPLAAEVARHAAQVVPVRTFGEDDVLLVGNSRARFDHDLTMPVTDLQAVLGAVRDRAG